MLSAAFSEFRRHLRRRAGRQVAADGDDVRAALPLVGGARRDQRRDHGWCTCSRSRSATTWVPHCRRICWASSPALAFVCFGLWTLRGDRLSDDEASRAQRTQPRPRSSRSPRRSSWPSSATRPCSPPSPWPPTTTGSGVWIGSTIGMVAADGAGHPASAPWPASTFPSGSSSSARPRCSCSSGCTCSSRAPSPPRRSAAAAAISVAVVLLLAARAARTAASVASCGVANPGLTARCRGSAEPCRGGSYRRGRRRTVPARIQLNSEGPTAAAAGRWCSKSNPAGCRLSVWLPDGTAGIYPTDAGAQAAPAPPLPLAFFAYSHAAAGMPGAVAGSRTVCRPPKNVRAASIMR